MWDGTARRRSGTAPATARALPRKGRSSAGPRRSRSRPRRFRSSRTPEKTKSHGLPLRPDDESGRTLGPGRFMVLTRLPLHVGTALPSSTPVEPPRASPAGSDLSAEEAVVAYHERTKHHYHRFASSLGYMDWATQPDPF